MSLLDSVLGGSPGMGLFGGGSRGGISPITLALLGTLAYRTFKGKGRLADMLGTSDNRGSVPTRATSASDLLSPAAISDGLTNLLNRFRQNGHAEKAESWVTTGANKAIAPTELEAGLGEERIGWLMSQTGLSKQELLAGLSETLPDAVDKLTPEGRVPTLQEAQRLMTAGSHS